MPQRSTVWTTSQIAFGLAPLPPLALLEREWRALEQVGSGSFFTSWDWIGVFLNIVPPDERPMLLRGTIGRETVALALLGCLDTHRRWRLVRSRVASLNATGDPRYDAVTIEHNGPLLARSVDRGAAMTALLGWARAGGHRFDELKIPGSLDTVPPALVLQGGLLAEDIAVPSYFVDLGKVARSGGFEATLSRNARAQLRRSLRQFEAKGPLTLTAPYSEAEAQSFFDMLKAFHCRSWARRGMRHSFDNPLFEPFARSLIANGYRTGSVQIWRAAAGATAFGFLLNFRHRDRVYAYQSGFDDNDEVLRPGVVSHYLAIDESLRSGAAVYDFMAGRNRLKESFATDCVNMRWHTFQQPLWRFYIETAARRLKERLFDLRRAVAERLAR